MKFESVVGIDASKETLDAVLLQGLHHRQFKNTAAGFKQLQKWVVKHSAQNIKEILFCCEHTGLYSLELSAYCTDQNIPLVLVSGLAVKKSRGMRRGKSDRIDAEELAQYAFEKQHKLKLYQLSSPTILKLHRLASLRRRLVTQRAGFQSSMQEYARVLTKKDNAVFFQVQQKTIEDLSKRITSVENEMYALINADSLLKRQFELVQTVRGVGPVIAVMMIVYTAGFSKFETWRQFATYIGTAPFAYQSGSTIKHPARLHHYKRPELKSLIHMGASSAILCDPELKAYYKRRLEKGKSRMSTLNIIRNKILARIFAVIQRDSAFVPLHKHAA
jgi:transposase